MTIDEKTSPVTTEFLHTGSISDFFPNPADRERFMFIKRLCYDFHQQPEEWKNLGHFASMAEAGFVAEARKLGATHAFSVQYGPQFVVTEATAWSGCIVVGDIYKRELR